MDYKFRNKNGITLIVLVITIIILLILAGVSITLLTGENGILNRVKEAKEKTEIAQLEERIILAHNSAIIRKELENIDVLQTMNEELKKDYPDINLKQIGNNYTVQIGNDQKYMFSNNKLIDMQPGLYDEYGNLVYTWKELLDNNFLSVNDGSLTSYTDPETNLNLTIENIKGNLVLDTSVKIIEASAFKKCIGLTGIVIPNSVIGMKDYIFEDCTNLINLSLPSSVTSFSPYTIAGCNKLSKIEVDNDNTVYSSIDGVLFNKIKNVLVRYPAGKEQDKYIIPSSVVTIGRYAFGRCNNLIEINIPESVTTIDSWAFSSCMGIKSITLGKNIESIGEYSLYNCKSLNDLIIEDGITKIPTAAFCNCTALSNIKLNDNITIIGGFPFKGDKALTTITIPSNITKLGLEAFYSTGLKSVTYKGIEYTSKSDLENTLQSNGVILENGVFDKTKLEN